MKEEIVRIETAKLAKEKCFNEEVRDWYNPTQDNELKPEDGGDMLERYNNTTHLLSAPTQSLLQKWLRDVHNIIITIIPSGTPWGLKFAYSIYLMDKPTSILKDEDWYFTYEEALEKGLENGLKKL